MTILLTFGALMCSDDVQNNKGTFGEFYRILVNPMKFYVPHAIWDYFGNCYTIQKELEDA